MSKKNVIDIPIISSEKKSPKIETINRGNPCFYKDNEHFIVYETNDFKLISKYPDLSNAFSVKPKDVNYVK
jgi:hypothetical protein